MTILFPYCDCYYSSQFSLFTTVMLTRAVDDFKLVDMKPLFPGEKKG